jgi:hypothetical protein
MIAGIYQALAKADTAKALYGDKIDWRLGGEALEMHLPAPRVVMWPTRENVAVRVPRGLPVGAKSVHIRSAGVRMYLYATGKCEHENDIDGRAVADIAACEQLLANVLWSIDACFKGAYEINGVDWIQQEGEALVETGRVCYLDVTFQIPAVLEAPVVPIDIFVPTTREQLFVTGVAKFAKPDGTTEIVEGNPAP